MRVGGDSGAQTIFPGSVHGSGEEITWSENGEPAIVADDDLLRRAKLLGALVLFARHWPGEGARHEAALTFGGVLARCGYKPPDAKYFMEAVAKAAGDNERRDRMQAAEDQAIVHQQGRKSRGYPTLKETFGDQIARKIADLLDYRGGRDDSPTAGKPSGKVTNDIVTEDSVAQQFIELHRDDLRFCHSHGKWFRWNGFYWHIDETGIAFHWARELARQLSEDQDKKTRFITNKTSFASGVERFAKHDPVAAVTIDYWDRDPWLLGTPAGTIDLRTGQLRAGTRQDGISKVTEVTPDGSGCPLWLQFLKQATGEDETLVRFLKQWLGYSLTGVTIEQALVFVFGDGGNGKGVSLNVTTAILKDYAVASAMETFTASSSDRHPTDWRCCVARGL